MWILTNYSLLIRIKAGLPCLGFAGGQAAEPFPAKHALYEISIPSYLSYIDEVDCQSQEDCVNNPDYLQVSHSVRLAILI